VIRPVAGEPPSAAPRAPRDRAGWVAAAYIGFPLIALAVALTGLRVTSVDQVTAAPLLHYDEGDALLTLPMIKDAVERADHWRNDRMGAPGAFQLYDFPVIDHLHFAGLWLVGQFTGSYLTAYNVYFLLTYPLTALTTLVVFRRFGYSLAAGGAGGLLYAFLHYHAARGQAHYFLSAYWVVPLSLMLVLRVCRGEPPLTEARAGQLRWAVGRREVVATLAIAVLTALGGAYYAFFTCALLAFAGVYGSLAARSWKPAVAATVLLGVVSAAGVAAHAPAVAYQAAHGRNPAPTKRLAHEAELYGLTLGHLFVPQIDHQSSALGALGTEYHLDGRPLPTEKHTSTLGVVASAGVIGAGATVLLPAARRWPFGPLGALIVFSVLFATVGGLGALFNFVLTAQIRAYCRLSVFIAFFGLCASVWALDRWLAAWPVVRAIVFAIITALGVLDQTPRPWFRPEMTVRREQIADRFASDREFFARVEATVPGEMVFGLPHLTYPSDLRQHRMPSPCQFAAGYLHTRTVKWSYGTMQEREVNRWNLEAAAEPVPLMAQRLKARGFAAVCVDARGYPEAEGAKLLADLTTVCGPPCARHADGSRVLFDLRGSQQHQRRGDDR
jgi:hypothetical protein